MNEYSEGRESPALLPVMMCAGLCGAKQVLSGSQSQALHSACLPVFSNVAEQVETLQHTAHQTEEQKLWKKLTKKGFFQKNKRSKRWKKVV